MPTIQNGKLLTVDGKVVGTVTDFSFDLPPVVVPEGQWPRSFAKSGTLHFENFDYKRLWRVLFPYRQTTRTADRRKAWESLRSTNGRPVPGYTSRRERRAAIRKAKEAHSR